jgi:predicted XRE-type DNA-binding protein
MERKNPDGWIASFIEPDDGPIELRRLDDSAEKQVRIQLAIQLHILICELKLSRKEVAEITGTDQPKISALLRGRTQGFSIDRLLRILCSLGADISISVELKQNNHEKGEKGKIKVV